ncbi:uncharacterized protein LOC132314373 isoform X2 [Cornus florida]|uniref:uncharacterized protein LOC132314373 isoform X2 n=1 Tax=Cornus florida TaxID=4283 RepID=UPI00289BC62D|nr:uncharacterized protein LOC132314373 isoform X2 [Cornus florida]
MPSLKMTTKSSSGCLREKSGLHVCQKSSMISKNSCSHVRISRQATDFQTSIQDEHAQDIGGDEVIDCNELLNGDNLQFQKQLSPLTDSATAERMESAIATCSSSMETIFSPLPDSIDNQSEPNVYSDAGTNGTLDVPRLGAEDSDSSRSSCEFQTCSVSDFYISDMIVAGLPIEGNSVYDDDITETTSFPDYRCDEPRLLFDMTEEYMILPFLEDAKETSNGHDGRTCEEAIIDSNDSSLYLAISQMRSCNQESDVSPDPDSDQAECFDPRMFFRNFPDLPDVATNWPTTLTKETLKTKPITLVLDLDETLVHSTLEHRDDADFTFPVFFNLKEHIVYVKQRPYLQTFLERVAEMFEIVIFTASQSIYAKQLLDILDPDGKFISRRAYRESCVFSDGSYTKDLTVLGVDLAKVAIIDNSPQVFQLQVNNGIPIKSWFDDPSDSALISLLPFLETLVDADDVRPIIAKRFGNKE